MAGETNTNETMTTTSPPAPESAEAKSQETAAPKDTLLGAQPAEEKKETPSEEKKEGDEAAKKDGEKPAALDTKSLKFPEGFAADDKVLEEFTGVLSDDKLSPQDRAQKLVDLHAKALKEAVERPSKIWDDIHTKWIDEVAKDKEFGTGNARAPLKPEAAAQISKVIEQFGSPEVREVMNITGAGNNPHVLRMVWNISKVLTEGNYKGGNPPAQATPKSGAEAMGFNFNPGGTPPAS